LCLISDADFRSQGRLPTTSLASRLALSEKGILSVVSHLETLVRSAQTLENESYGRSLGFLLLLSLLQVEDDGPVIDIVILDAFLFGKFPEGLLHTSIIWRGLILQ
jgi:hypothetical protein